MAEKETCPSESSQRQWPKWITQDRKGMSSPMRGVISTESKCTSKSLHPDGLRTPSGKLDQVTFEEVAVDFTEEDWTLLNPSQKALHWEVMEEILGALSSLSSDEQLKERNEKPCQALMQRDLCKQVKEKERKTDTEIKWKITIQERIQKQKKRSKYLCLGQGLTLYRRIQTKGKSIKGGESGNSYRRMRHFRCLECGKGFAWKTTFSRHQATHTGKKPFKCLECGKSFIQRTHLTYHQKTHTGEKPFKCLECGKSYIQKRHLTYHQKTHTGEKPFKCLECGKGFAQKSHLTRHQATHTGEKPFKCLECGKSYIQKTHLTYHQKTHTGEKPFKCL